MQLLFRRDIYDNNRYTHISLKGQCNGALTGNCIENTPYDQVVCLYNNGSLWNQHKEFEVIYSECLDNKAIYQYRMDENVSYALYYNEYYKYVDSVETSGKWIVALDDGVTTEVAKCDEYDLMKCGAGNWKVLWNVNDDALQLIVDQTMSVKNGRCRSLQQNYMESSTAFGFFGLVLFVIILAICGFFTYRRSKKLKMEKAVEFTQQSVVEDHSEDEEDEEVEVVEVEVEQLTNLTETNE